MLQRSGSTGENSNSIHTKAPGTAKLNNGRPLFGIRGMPCVLGMANAVEKEIEITTIACAVRGAKIPLHRICEEAMESLHGGIVSRES